MAIDTDLKTWANAQGWKLDDENETVDLDVDYDFDPETIKEGVYKVTFWTTGREFKIHTTDYVEEGKEVGLTFFAEDIHVMEKMGFQKMKKFQQLAIPYIVWACIMLLLPMLLIAFYSIIQQGNSIVHFKLTLDNYVRFFTDKDFLLILWRSLWIAIKTTIICLLIGYPIAYFISKNSPKVQQILVLAITLPTWINMLVRTYAWNGI